MNRVVVMGRREVERIARWERPTALISITDPSVHGPQASAAKVACNSNLVGLLRLTFHDMDPIRWPELRGTESEWHTAGHAGPQWMTDEQAKSVVAFWRSVAPYVLDLVVHCEAGISRSAGVAAALCVLAGFDDAWCYQNHRPNAHVKAAVLRAARGAPA